MVQEHINWLVQERRNSIANAMELRLSYINPSTSHMVGGSGAVHQM